MENGKENEQMGLRTGNYNKVAREAFDAPVTPPQPPSANISPARLSMDID